MKNKRVSRHTEIGFSPFPLAFSVFTAARVHVLAATRAALSVGLKEGASMAVDLAVAAIAASLIPGIPQLVVGNAVTLRGCLRHAIGMCQKMALMGTIDPHIVLMVCCVPKLARQSTLL